MLDYALLLVATIALSALSYNAFGTAVIVAIGFMFNETFVRLSMSPDPWWFFAVVDACCATTIIALNLGKTGAAVAALFATQVLMHVAYYVGGEKDYNAYLDALYQLALMQLLVIAAGGMLGGGRLSRIVSRLRRVGHVGDPAHSRSLERGDGQ